MAAPATPEEQDAGGTGAAGPLQAMADVLTSHAFDVRSPVWENARVMSITNARGVLCDLSLHADGRVRFECLPCPGTFTSPAHTVATVLAVLGAGMRDPDAVLLTPHQGLTFKGAVARTLAGYGMNARLNVIHRDEADFDIYAEVEVTNPVLPGRGRVSVADDGSLGWDCAFSDPATDPAGLGPVQIADIVAQALARYRV